VAAPTPTAAPADGWTERGPVTLALGGDSTGAWRDAITGWNAAHPNERVTLVELPDSVDQQYLDLVERLEAGSGEFTVVGLDTAWTSQFAAKGWLTELPDGRFPTTGMVPAAVASGTWQGARYAYPQAVDAGLLYYRSDLLTEAGLEPPTTWAELEAACATILLTHPAMSCYAGQYVGEGLTVNLAEAIASAGGTILAATGKPTVDSSAAQSGLEWLAGAVSAGLIPDAALSWDAARSRAAFAAGDLVFLRHWADSWAPLRASDGTSSVAEAFGVTTLPGKLGPGVAVLGGRNLAIPVHARNKGTAAGFLGYLASSDLQHSFAEAGASGPVLQGLYDERSLARQAPWLPALRTALRTAIARPQAERYDEVSRAIQEAGAPVLRGERTADAALGTLQTRLTELLG
jgi:multiple sugar transport system substrate-binding protein